MNKLIGFIFASAFLLPASIPAFAQPKTSPESIDNGRPRDFPLPPKTENSLFFIQRNRNTNTIVYDARLKPSGEFDETQPVDAYWLRYSSDHGNRMELTWVQRHLAYGYNFKADNKGQGYWVTLTAYDKRKIHLKKNKSGKPTATMTINGKNCHLNYIWVFADESGTWPKVLHVDLHGTDPSKNQAEFERIYNK